MKIEVVAAFLAAFSVLAMTGCQALTSAVGTAKNNPETARMVTDQITVRLIEQADDPKERAVAVRDVVNTVREQVNSDAEATLESIEKRARDEIDWEGLSTADRQILEFALLKARQSLEDLIGDGLLDPQERATVGTLLDWVDGAAQRVAE